MNVTEPNVKAWTPAAIAAFLEVEGPYGLTAADLAVYVKMRQAYEGWERTARMKPTKAELEVRERAYVSFKNARAEWARVMLRLHPPPRAVQTISPPEEP